MDEFGWYALIYVAAKENYTKIPKVLKSNAIEFLHFCNFYKRKTQLDIERINKDSQK